MFVSLFMPEDRLVINADVAGGTSDYMARTLEKKA